METKMCHEVSPIDDFGGSIGETFVDGQTKEGLWCKMNEENFILHGVGIGMDVGHRFKKTGKTWVKIEG